MTQQLAVLADDNVANELGLTDQSIERRRRIVDLTEEDCGRPGSAWRRCTDPAAAWGGDLGGGAARSRRHILLQCRTGPAGGISGNRIVNVAP